MTTYVLGIDGGGTSTRAAILSDAGDICCLGASDRSNCSDVGVPATRANLLEAVTRAVRKCRRRAIGPGMHPAPLRKADLWG
jgi:N-acetylglucosamine kinase-like BadF-type ATPase